MSLEHKRKNINEYPKLGKNISDIENFNDQKLKFIDENKFKMFIKDLIKEVGGNNNIPTLNKIDKTISILRKKYKITGSKNQYRYIYEKYYNDIPINYMLTRYMIKNAGRSRSGVLVSTIVLRPDVFSCPQKCSYCPTETDLNGKRTQPKSYLSSEPAMMRALQYNFDVKGQLWDRIKSYIKTGNIKESSGSHKIEMIFSGGTWESYPYDYRNQVMVEIYWAANTFGEENSRSILSLEEEIAINETAKYRIIGLSIETRPDFITRKAIKDYRRWGVTRVQIGIQHYDDEILKGINRECYNKDTIKCIFMLKQSGFKIVGHLMPDLPGSSPERDTWMFYTAIYNSDQQIDEWKVYPTAVCQSSDPNLIVTSDIADWYKQGLYVPYAEKDINSLINVLIYLKTNIQPWVRIQRLVRDIPNQSIKAGYAMREGFKININVIEQQLSKFNIMLKYCGIQKIINTIFNKFSLKQQKVIINKEKVKHNEVNDENNVERKSCTNLRQIIQQEMETKGLKCYCIRCMEIGDRVESSSDLVVRQYKASNGQEYYISIESNNKSSVFSCNFWSYVWFLITYYFNLIFYGIETFWGGDMKTYNGLIGFCRFRINAKTDDIIFKELEDCAIIREVHVYGHSLSIGSSEKSSQHKGYGQLLVNAAETIAMQNGFGKVAVIAGVGTREYYKNKCGYHLEGTYMVKNLERKNYKYVKVRKLIPYFWIFITNFNVMISFLLFAFYILNIRIRHLFSN